MSLRRLLRFEAAVVALIVVTGACASANSEEEDAGSDATTAATRPPGSAVPRLETPPADGDADDPAIWVHPTDPAASLVIGTDKDNGLGVYDLDGRLLQFVEEGEPNNVDLRDGFPLGGQSVSLVVAADDSHQGELLVYRIDPATRRLVDVAVRALETGIKAHGLCLYHSNASGRLYAFPNDRDGGTEQWELFDDGSGRVDARKVRSFDAGEGVEGCVADDATGMLFVGDEKEGVYRFGAEPDAPDSDPAVVDRTGDPGRLTADVEGLALLDVAGGERYLIVSSQGDNSFAVYRRDDPHQFVGRFQVPTGPGGVDGCEDTDGIEIVNRPLGAAFPAGLFVCQDGENEGAGGEEESNFKFVSLEAIIAAIAAITG